MSHNWENVIWESKDGSWNRAYYKRISCENSYDDRDGEPYDSEWDDEFDYEEFAAVDTGFRSQSDAQKWEPFGNPGSADTLAYRGNSADCKTLDLRAFHERNPEAKAKHERAVHNRKRRERARALEEKWTELGGIAAKKIRVLISSDDRTYSGSGRIYSGIARQTGDWLTLDGQKIFNTKTNKFHGRIASVDKVEFQRGYSSRW